MSYDRFRRENLSSENRAEFFKTGEEYVNWILEHIKRHIDPDFLPKRAVDFGCGTGRLAIPLAEKMENVDGIDISESVLQEAQRNCHERSLENVTFVKSDDELSLLEGKFDLIHSFIIFQHIPVARGVAIFKKLLDHLNEGGVSVVHFIYYKPEWALWRRGLQWTKDNVPILKGLVNVVRGRKFGFPEMQMNVYDLNCLAALIEDTNASDYFVEYTKHHGGGIRGVPLYSRKRSAP